MTMRAIAPTLITCTAAILLALLITPKGSSAQTTPPAVKEPEFRRAGVSDTSSMLRLKWKAPDTAVVPPITGYEVQYRIDGETGWTDHVFDSDGSTTETTITGLKSHTGYYARVRAVNDDGPGVWSQGPLWAMTERARLTLALSAATYRVGEGETITAAVTVTPDADQDLTVTVEITDGTGATLSGLDTDNMLTIAKAQSSASFTISAEDDDDADDDEVTLELRTDEYDYYQVLGTPYTAIVTIIDDDGSNTPPVITTTSPVTVQENETAVATLKATDPDNDPITGWSISGGADSALFSLTKDGVLTFVTAPDYENPKDDVNDNSYVVKVTANDGTDDSAELTLTVNVTDVNEPPPQMELPALSAAGTDDTTSMLLLKWSIPVLPEGTPIVTSYDVQYRLKGETDWVDHDFDSVATTTETTITGLASNTNYEAQVRAVNVEGAAGWSPTSEAKTAEARLTVAFNAATYSVGEEEETTITVTVTPTADRDITVTITMTGAGATLSGLGTGNILTITRGQGSGSFTIFANQDNDAVNDEVTLTLGANQNDYVFLGRPFTATINIIDDEEPNSSPVIATTSPIIVEENQTAVATLEATDSDDDPITEWSIIDGADRALFSLTDDGVLTFVTAPDYENPRDAGRDNGYEVAVTASDGTDDSTPKTITVNVTDVDEPPGAPTDLSVSTNDDNPSTALDVSWTAPDPDGIPPITDYDIQYRKHSEIDWTNHNFDPVGTTTMTTVPNLDSNTTYQVQVRATNDEGEGQWAMDSGTTGKANLTVAFSAATFTVGEGGTATTTVTVTPTADRDITVTITMTGTGATLSGLNNGNALTIERGENSSSFTISGDQDDDVMDGEVTLTLSTDADGVSVGNPSTTTVTIIDDEVPNSPPTFATTTVNRIIPENSPVGTLLGDPIAATDPENDSLTYSLSGEGSEYFNVYNQGQITLRASLNYEDKPSYTLTLSVRDSKDGIGNPDSETDATTTVNVTVVDVDEPPGPPTGLSVSTNQDNPTTALEVSWTAPDTTGIPPITGYDVEYRAGDSGMWTAHEFESDDNTTETTIPDLASNTTYQVQARAKNDEGEGQWAASSGTTGKANLTVTFSAATYTVDEGEEATITVIVTPTADRSVTVTVTMIGSGASISALDTGNTLTIARGQSSGRFTISGDQDEDAIDSEVSLTLSTSDDGVTLGSPSTSTVTVIDDEEPNNPPVITATSTLNIQENQTTVATLEATDSDDDPITGWSIRGGADLALFDLTNSGVLSFKSAPDYENPTDSGTDNTYQVEVIASDGTDDSAPKTITVNVTDINEPPTFSESTLTTRTIAENSPEGTDVGGPFTAVDPEGDALMYKLSGTGHENFTVDTNGQIIVASNAVLDFETRPTYTLELNVSDQKDADGNPNSEVDDTITITINLTDVPPPPQLELPAFSAAGTADTTSMLILKWVAPTLLEGTPSITGYEVQYREQEETNWIVHIFESDGSTSETTISGLASNTYYDAQVRAVNVEGPGLWSATSSAKTTEAALTVAFSSATYTVGEGDTATTTVEVTPTADRDVTVTVNTTGTGATLSGIDADNALTIARGQNSASFTISADQDEDAIDSEVSLTLSTSDDGVTLGSPSTSTVTVIDDEIPNSPPAFATTTVNRIISEDSPMGTPLGDPIAATDPEDDSLTYTLSGEGSEHFNVNNQGQITLSANLNHEDTPSYNLTLSVSDIKDDVGNPDSEADTSATVNVTVVDVDEPPGPPTDLSISTNDDNPTTAMDVSWVSPKTMGIPPITGYDVQYRSGGLGAWTTHNFDSVGTATMTTISDLDSNTTYQVQVRATNDEGKGQRTTSSGTTEKANLTVTFISATYTLNEGDTATSTVTVTPTTDRDVTVTITMTGAGATLSGLTNEMLTIERGENSDSFTISADQDNDATDGEVVLTLSTDDDGVTLGSPSTSTVTIIDDEEPNNPPVITATSTITVQENRTVIVTLEATDSDNDPITGWSITGGADRALFSLTNDGVLAFVAAPDYENPKDVGRDNSYEVEVTASDGKDDSAPMTITVNVTDINEPPTFSESTLTTRTIAENSSEGTDVGGPFTAVDPEGDALMYELSGTGHENFTVDTNGQIIVASNAVLDFETRPTYTLELNVSDQKDADGNSNSEVDDTITITINLTDVQPPPQTELPAFSAAGTADTTSMLILKWVAPTLLEGTPSITGYEVQYREQEEANWIVHNFKSDGSTTTETTITGLASNTSYEAQIRAVNIEGPGDWSPTSSAKTTEAELTVAFSAATYTVDEGEEATITVTVTPTADRDVTVTIAMTGAGATLYGLNNGNALTIERGENSSSFTISGDQDDDVMDGEVTLTLSTDADGVSLGSPTATTVTIEVPNSPPVITATSTLNIQENQTTVATLEATDSDDDPITGWSITGGADLALFDLTNSGVLSFKSAPDYENPTDIGRDNSYLVEVTASDGTDDSAPKTITVNVTDINEPPGAPTDLSISTNDDNPTTALDVSWTAPDTTGIPAVAGYDTRYRVQGETDWIDHDFDSVGTTTKTTVSNLATNTTYQVQARAKNNEGEGQWAASSGITEKARLTIAFSAATYTVDEGEEATITVIVTPTADRNVTVKVTMSGTGATLSGLGTGDSLTIARGQNSASLTISGDEDNNATDGEVTLTLSTDDDDVTLGSPSTSTVTIIDDEESNNPPVITATSTIAVQENQTTVATLEATDSDDDPITGWSITGGADSALFNLTNGGVLSFKASPDYENPTDTGTDNSYEVEVIASDGTDDSAPKTITVNVANVNEPPPRIEQPAFSAAGTLDTTSMLRLKWEVPVLPDGTPSITGYEVQYRVQGDTDWIDHDFDSDGSTIEMTITGLASNTYYDAQVRAVNVEGPGSWSKTSSAKTIEAELTVAFSAATYTVDEGEEATITVTVTPTADRDVTVTITMTGTGATLSGIDADNTLTIPRSQNSVSFSISGDQDDDTTDDEVILTLGADEDNYVLPGSPFTATVTIEEPNNPPVITTTSPITVKENQTAIATLEATDSDDDPITGWSITGGADHALFDLTNSGVLSFKSAPDYENPIDSGTDNSCEVEVIASDGTDDSAPKTITVNVTDLNEPPTFSESTLTTRTIAENSPEGTDVGGPFTAVDPEGDALMYKLSGTGHENFAVDTNGQIIVASNAVLDFETRPTYTLELNVSDQKDADGNPNSEVDDTITITINLTDVPPPPQMELPAFSAAGTADTTSMLILKWVAPTLLEGTPSITGYEVQYRVQGDTDWIDHDFDSDGSTIEMTITGLASNTSYDAQVRAVNVEGLGPWSPTSSATTTEAALTVAFGSPTYTVHEGVTATSTVTVTPTTDRDVTVTITMTGTGATLYGLTSGMLTIERGQNSDSFTISGDQDDDAINDEVTLALSTDDDGVSVGSPSTTTVTIIDDEEPNFPPAFATTTVNRIIPEDSPMGTLLGDSIAATDPEDDSLTYLLSGDGSEHFNINNDGQITLSVSLNHEDKPSYTLTLSVRDSKDGIGNPNSETDATTTVNVTVVDVDEPPGPPTGLSISTSQDNPTTALDVSWTAPDADGIPPITGYEIQYRKHSEIDWTNHNFDPVGTTTMTTVPNLDSNTTYQVQVRATNDEGKGQWATSSGTTEKANLTVAFISATYTLNEGDTATSTVTVTPTTDRDVTVTITMTGAGATLSGLTNEMLTIERGENSDSFTISADQDNDATDGEVVLTLSTDDDSVSVGNPSTSTVTIIDDEVPNSPPVITATSTIAVQENQTTVATLEATDSDDDPITGWSITGGADSALFNLTNGGVLSFKASPDYENPTDTGTDNSYEVEVIASDGTDDSAPKTITVNVTDINEPPTFSESTLTTRTIAENSPESTQVGSITADDPEDDALVYELSGTGHEEFEVDANGQITVATNAVLDFETLHTYTLELNVSDQKDADGNSNSEVDDTITITINLTDIQPPPQMELPAFSAAGTADTTSMLILKWVAPTLLEGTPSITG